MFESLVSDLSRTLTIRTKPQCFLPNIPKPPDRSISPTQIRQPLLSLLYHQIQHILELIFPRLHSPLRNLLIHQMNSNQKCFRSQPVLSTLLHPCHPELHGGVQRRALNTYLPHIHIHDLYTVSSEILRYLLDQHLHRCRQPAPHVD